MWFGSSLREQSVSRYQLGRDQLIELFRGAPGAHNLSCLLPGTDRTRPGFLPVLIGRDQDLSQYYSDETRISLGTDRDVAR